MIVARLIHDVPVIPDGSTAQDWALDELSKPIYHEGKSLATMLYEWLQEFFTELLKAAEQTSLPSWLLLAIVVLAVGLAAWKFVGVPLQRNRRQATPMFADQARSAASFRDEADAAAAAGDYSAAVIARFRAIIRSLEERAILDEAPGRTAREAGFEAGQVLSAQASALASAARLFDQVAYGKSGAGIDDDALLRELDAALHIARPVP